MHYTELEIIDKMKFCRKSNPDLIRNYIKLLPEWRNILFERHIKYVNSILRYSTYKEISNIQGYSIDGIENIFRKIQTCLELELEYKYKSKINKYKVRNNDKDDMLNSMFKYIKSLPYINKKNIININRYQILKLILENNSICEIENKMGIDSDKIYSYLISSETDTIFNDLK